MTAASRRGAVLAVAVLALAALPRRAELSRAGAAGRRRGAAGLPESTAGDDGGAAGCVVAPLRVTPRLDGLVQEALTANRNLAAADANFAAARAALSGRARQPLSLHRPDVAGGMYGRDPVTDEILELGGQRPQNALAVRGRLPGGLRGRSVRPRAPRHRGGECQRGRRRPPRATACGSWSRRKPRAPTRRYARWASSSTSRTSSLEVVHQEPRSPAPAPRPEPDSEFDVARAQALVAQVASRHPTARRPAARRAVRAHGAARPDTGRGAAGLESCVAPPHLAALMPVGDGAALIRRRPDVRAGRAAAGRRDRADRRRDGGSVSRAFACRASMAARPSEVPQLNTNIGRVWGVGPSISWQFPEHGRSARARSPGQGLAGRGAGAVRFRGAHGAQGNRAGAGRYGAALDNRQALGDAQRKIHRPSTSRATGMPLARRAISTCSPPSSPWSRSTPRSPHPIPS